jgi:hypothetical protein
MRCREASYLDWLVVAMAECAFEEYTVHVGQNEFEKMSGKQRLNAKTSGSSSIW